MGRSRFPPRSLFQKVCSPSQALSSTHFALSIWPCSTEPGLVRPIARHTSRSWCCLPPEDISKRHLSSLCHGVSAEVMPQHAHWLLLKMMQKHIFQGAQLWLIMSPYTSNSILMPLPGISGRQKSRGAAHAHFRLVNFSLIEKSTRRKTRFWASATYMIALSEGHTQIVLVDTDEQLSRWR